MTIDEKLKGILSGSPPPTYVTQWYPSAAPQGVTGVYGIYTLYASPQILTHDRQTSTKKWRYELAIYDQQYLRAKAAVEILLDFLHNYTDLPFRAGIQAVIPLDQGVKYDQVQRLHVPWGTVDITENLV